MILLLEYIKRYFWGFKNIAQFKIVFVAYFLAFSCSPLSQYNSSDQEHIWKLSDNLGQLALSYNVDPAEIRHANNIYSENDLVPGMKIIIPGAKRIKREHLFLEASLDQRPLLPRSGDNYSVPSQKYYKSGLDLLIWPLKGSITSKYGMRWGRLHEGIDISAPYGTKIKAVDSGKVITAKRVSGYGLTVELEHNNLAGLGANYSTVYGHASKLLVKVGQQVGKGDVIALVGNTGRSTGNHLHFEIKRNQKPFDPLTLLPQNKSLKFAFKN